jgi:hypothetical protein
VRLGTSPSSPDCKERPPHRQFHRATGSFAPDRICPLPSVGSHKLEGRGNMPCRFRIQMSVAESGAVDTPVVCTSSPHSSRFRSRGDLSAQVGTTTPDRSSRDAAGSCPPDRRSMRVVLPMHWPHSPTIVPRDSRGRKRSGMDMPGQAARMRLNGSCGPPPTPLSGHDHSQGGLPAFAAYPKQVDTRAPVVRVDRERRGAA